MPRIAVPKELRHLYTPDEVAQMIENAPTLKDKSLIAFYYIFGVREKEPFFVRKEDIWMDNEFFYVKVKREKIPEGMVLPRIDTLKVKLSTIFLNYIIEHLNEVKDGEYIWFYANNFETSRHKVYLMIKKLNPEGWIHLFRHTRAERFREKGYSDAELMAWFGWINPNTPRKYTHPSNKTIEEMGNEIE